MKPYLLAALAAALLASGCKKADSDPASRLPPATQTGANIFSCLVNGQPYTPSGYNGTTNYAVLYDPGFQGGSLEVRTYRYPQSGIAKTEKVAFGGINVDHIGAYQIGVVSDVGASFINDYRSVPCNEYRSNRSGTFSKGTLTITRLDLQAGIIAGTFAFILAKPGCDTVRVTQGRFDKKL